MTVVVVVGPLLASGIMAALTLTRRRVRTIIAAPRAGVSRPNSHSGKSGSAQPARWRSFVRVAGLGTVALVSPAAAIVLAAGWYSVSIAGRRRRGRSETDARVNGLAEVIELFALTLISGGTVLSAITQGSHWAPAPYDEAFQSCARQAGRGRPLGEVLDDLPKVVGEGIRPLVAALVAHDRYGAPIGPNLVRLAGEARADRRRRAEATARRLPITMLFPLVLCVLPAFLLLTVVPVVADTIGGLDFLASP